MTTRFNRRLTERRSLHAPGKVIDPFGTIVACTVIDASAQGFRIEIGPGQALPRNGWLQLEGQTWNVEHVWRSGGQAGLRVITDTEDRVASGERIPTAPRLSLADLRRLVAKS